MFKWKQGRRATGYLKCHLFSGSWPTFFDCWLLKFPVESFVDMHTDQYSGGKHYRMNITLTTSFQEMVLHGEYIYNSKYIKIFRPDLYKHGLPKVFNRAIYMLSIGWVLK